MHRVTLYIRTAFQFIEDTLRNTFLLAHFKGATYQIPGILVTSIPVKKSGATSYQSQKP